VSANTVTQTDAPGSGQANAAPANARRADYYARAARRYGRLQVRVERLIARVAAIRFAAFVVAVLSGFVAWQDRAPAWLPVTALALIAFIAAVWIHRRPFALAPRLRALTELCREGEARLRGQWAALPDDGARYLDEARPELGELQVFGPGSLYQLLNRCALPGGRDRLAALLTDGLEPGEIPPRQAAAQTLAPLAGLRRRVEAEGRLAAVDQAALSQFLAWAEADDHQKWLRPFVWISALLVPATIIQGVLTLAFEIPTLYQLTFLAQLLVFGLTTRRISAGYLPLLADRHRPFLALRRMFERLERRHFDDAALATMQRTFGGTDRPSKRMGRLEGIVESLAVRHSALLYAVVSLVLMWEVFQGARLEAWRAAAGQRVRAELDALADFEALSSIAGFAADHPTYTWPEVTPASDGPALTTRAIGYPLFDVTTRKHNDFTHDRSGQLVLITGSNMSGKSSFLRTLGANVILAQAGATVCADALRVHACHLSTSIQITDAPAQGLSRFYAEVKRIRRILTEVETAESSDDLRPRLYLIDEMLSGTNSRERHLASRTIVHRLIGAARSFGLVTTHDLELVAAADVDPAVMPLYHFSDHFDGEKLHFEYALQTGIATTTNALHVLRMEGIVVEA
jgi:hypothetical protein